MNSKRTLKLSVLIGAVLLFCFSLFTAFSVKAESYNEAQTGVVIHQNYDISTANGGTYADLLLNKNNDLSDYYKNYYSGGAIDFKNGYMYEADAKGVTSTVRLFEEYSGTFSIIGQGFYDTYGIENGAFVADYGRLAFQFTNLANDKQYYKFSFTQTASHYLELNVYYYDKGVNTTTYLNKVTKKIAMSFTEKSALMQNKNLPFRFEYVMATQTLNMRDENVTTGQTHDLSALAGTTLPVFERYSVDMLFENKSQKNTAKFIVYELCKQIPSYAVVDGFNIQTANNGAYANYAIDSTKLSEYFATNYSGNYINFNNGRLYEATKKNTASTIRLFEERSGEFSIVGQGFYDEFTASSSGFTGDYGRFALQFTNTENTQEYLKFSFVQSSYHYLELNIYYYDKTQNANTYLDSTKLNVCASFTGTAGYLSNKNIPLKFKYNVDTYALDVYTTEYKSTYNLNNILTKVELPVFESYSVDMLFENKSQKTTAKFIAYELCGNAFAETQTLTITDMSGTKVKEIGAVEGAKYVLPANETKGFVGYEIEGKIYPAGYALTVDKAVTAKQMFITPTMVDGASVRTQITQDYVGGIRFLVTVDDAVISAFGENATVYGVLIYTDSIVGDFDLDEAGSQCKALENYYEKDGVRGYYITLTNVQAGHYQTSYSVRAYVAVTLYDGSVMKVATDYSAENNARSPYEVAQKAEQDGVSGTMIDAYLGRTANGQN